MLSFSLSMSTLKATGGEGVAGGQSLQIQLLGTKNLFVCLLIEPWESPNSFLKTKLKNWLWAPLPGFPQSPVPWKPFYLLDYGV